MIFGLFKKKPKIEWKPIRNKVYKTGIGNTERKYVHLSGQRVGILLDGKKVPGSFKASTHWVEIRTKGKNLIIPIDNCSFSIKTKRHIGNHCCEVEESVWCTVKSYNESDISRFTEWKRN